MNDKELRNKLKRYARLRFKKENMPYKLLLNIYNHQNEAIKDIYMKEIESYLEAIDKGELQPGESGLNIIINKLTANEGDTQKDN